MTTFKRAGFRHIAVHYTGGKPLAFRLVAQSIYVNITEALKGEITIEKLLVLKDAPASNFGAAVKTAREQRPLFLPF